MNAEDEEDDVNEPLKEKVVTSQFPKMSHIFIKAKNNRELGKFKGFNIKSSIEAYAEDKLVQGGLDELKCEVPGTPRSTFLMVFSPDGTKVASTHGDHNIYVTDLKSGKNIKTLIGHPRTPWCIAFHPTSNDLVASGCLAGQVRIWDLSGGSEVWISKRGSVISSIAFHPVDRLVVIATFHEIFFWDWSKPEPLRQASTSNIKEKVRYVAFDKLGHKLITGIANSPQSRWERNRLTESTGNPYRRRIFPRVGIPFLSHSSTAINNTNNNERPFVSTVPERERRITACYRNLVHEYELLVHRYLQIYQPPTTIDRGTDPMDTDNNQPSTSATSSSVLSTPTPVPGASLSALTGDQEPAPSTSNSVSTRPYRTLHSPKNTQTVTHTRVKIFPKRKNTLGFNSTEPRKRKLHSDTPSSTLLPNEERNTSVDVSSENTELASIALTSREEEQTATNNASENNESPSSAFTTSPGAFRRCLILRTSVPSTSSTTQSETPDSSRYNVYRMKIKCSPKQKSTEKTSQDNLINLREKIAEIQRSFAKIKEKARNELRPSTSTAETAPPTDKKNSKPVKEANHIKVTAQLKRIYPGFLKKPNRRPVLDTSSDSSSEDEERRKKRLYSQRNYSHVTNKNESVPSISETTEKNASTLQSSTSTNSQTFKPLSLTVLLNPQSNNNGNGNGNVNVTSTAEIPTSSLTTSNSEQQVNESCARTTEINTPCARTLMNTDTRTTNSTVYTPSGIRRRFFSQRFSAFYPTRVYNMRSQSRLRRPNNFPLTPTFRRIIDEFETFDTDNSGLPVNLAPDETVNYSERVNSEDDLTDQNLSSVGFHPFDPPPDVPSINPENIGIGNMYSNIVQDLEMSLRNVRNIRASTRPGETSDMLSSFSERLESIMHQSNSILRNLRNTMDMLPPTSRPNEASRPTDSPHFSFNDLNFYVRENNDNESSPNFNRSSATTDHTYPRNPLEQNFLRSPDNNVYVRSSLSPSAPESMTPLMTSLHLTISHIQRQAGLLRRQVESIERIDRAMLEVAQLQMIRQMFEELRRHVGTFGNNLDSRGGVSSVRQMMAGTRISDTSPYDSPNETNEQSNSTGESSSRPQTSSRSSARKSYPPSRLQQLQRQNRRFSIVNFFPPRRVLGRDRFLRRRTSRIESTSARLAENQSSLSAEILNVMIRRLEQLLTKHLRFMDLPPDLQPVPVRDNREHVVIERLNRCRVRLNHTLGRVANSNMHPSYRIEVTSATQDSMLRFGAREAMSLILNTFTRYFESTTNSNFSQNFRSYVRTVIDLSLLLSDILLLHILDSIPPPAGMNIVPERENLSDRIDEACTRMLQNRSSSHSQTLTRTLRITRLTARCAARVFEETYNSRRNSLVSSSTGNHSENIRELLGRMNDTLHSMHAIRGMSYNPVDVPLQSLNPERERNSTGSDVPMREWYSGINQSVNGNETVSDGFSRLGSSTHHIDLTNSDEEETETTYNWGITSQNDNATDGSNNNNNNNNNSSYYNSSLNNSNTLSTPSESSGSNGTAGTIANNSSEDTNQSTSQGRSWNVPLVQINDVPVSEASFSSWQTRILPLRYRLSELRSTTGPNVFRPRFFLLPSLGGVNVNPLESDVDESQRDTLNDGEMVLAASPNHRIQAWDISTGVVPDINNAFKNVVVGECRIHNDASVDISKDGNILVTLLPSSGYPNYSNRLGVYSLKWESLGQCLYITNFEQNAVSVSLSPLSRHLVVGLAAKRMSIISSDRGTMARIFLIETKKVYGNNITVLRDIYQDRDNNIMSLNCIRWLPISGQGLIYATNTGQLRILS